MSNKQTDTTPAAGHRSHSVPHKAAHDAKPAGSHARAPAQSESADANLADHWAKLSVKLQEKWSALTDDDLKFVDKTVVALVAKIRERTGLEADMAERQLDLVIASVAPAPH